MNTVYQDELTLDEAGPSDVRTTHAFCNYCEPEGSPFPHKAMCGLVANTFSSGKSERCVVCLEMCKLPSCPVCGGAWSG